MNIHMYHSGELLLWDIGQKKPSWRLMGAGDGAHGHTRIIFNVALGGPNLNHLSTISMDRQLIVWNLESLSPEWCIPTLGGFAYALAFSPFQPGKEMHEFLEVPLLSSLCL